MIIFECQRRRARMEEIKRLRREKHLKRLEAQLWKAIESMPSGFERRQLITDLFRLQMQQVWS